MIAFFIDTLLGSMHAGEPAVESREQASQRTRSKESAHREQRARQQRARRREQRAESPPVADTFMIQVSRRY